MHVHHTSDKFTCVKNQEQGVAGEGGMGGMRGARERARWWMFFS